MKSYSREVLQTNAIILATQSIFASPPVLVSITSLKPNKLHVYVTVAYLYANSGFHFVTYIATRELQCLSEFLGNFVALRMGAEVGELCEYLWIEQF